MAVVIIGQKRVAPKRSGLFRTNIACGGESIVVRRKLSIPPDYQHKNSKAVKDQRERMATASKAYAKLSPREKVDQRKAWGFRERVDKGCAKVTLLTGRQLFISEAIEQLAAKGTKKKPLFKVCIILCDEALTPLEGKLTLEYTKGDPWKEIHGLELCTGNWLFQAIPTEAAPYRVIGEAVGYYDPENPNDQAATEDYLRQKRYHPMKKYKGNRVMSFPDPGTERTTVDGYVGKYSHNTWAAQRGGVAEQWSDSATEFSIGIARSYLANRWQKIARAIYLFDTRLIPDEATIMAADFYVGCYGKTQTGGMDGAFNVFGSHPGADTAIVKEDWTKFSSTPLAQELTHANIIDGEENVWHLNEAGLAYIEKEGITKLALLESHYDAPNIEPTWTPDAFTTVGVSFVDTIDIHKRPRLEIFHTDV